MLLGSSPNALRLLVTRLHLLLIRYPRGFSELRNSEETSPIRNGRVTNLYLRRLGIRCFALSHYGGNLGAGEERSKARLKADSSLPVEPFGIRNALNFGINRGEITNDQCDDVLAEIEAQIDKGFFRLVEASQSRIYAKAQELSNAHAPTVDTRSLDLMHLATAMLSNAGAFLTFDKRQAKVAITEKISVKP
jgi:hypothetical protein